MLISVAAVPSEMETQQYDMGSGSFKADPSLEMHPDHHCFICSILWTVSQQIFMMILALL